MNNPFQRAELSIPSGMVLMFRGAERIAEASGSHGAAESLAEQMRREVAAMDWTHRDATPEKPVQTELCPGMMNGSQAKTAYALRLNCENMIAGHQRRRLAEFDGPEGKQKAWITEKPQNLHCTGFLTLTVGDYVCDHHGKQLPAHDGRGERVNRCPICGFRMNFHGVRDAAEASRRFNNINRRLLKVVFSKAVVVTERHANGNVHFHLLGLLASGADIRTGLDFDAIAKRDYRSASEPLRGLWAMLREKLPEYGFGRAELLPVRKTGEAVAAYVSKYVEKHVCNRLRDDHRKKLVRYIGFEKMQLKPNEFSWAGARACAWRAKTRECAALIGAETREQAAEALGPRWAFHISNLWRRISDQVFPGMIWPDAFATRNWVKNELGRLAGHDWCRRSEAERKYLVAGEIYTATEYRKAGFSGTQLRQPDGLCTN